MAENTKYEPYVPHHMTEADRRIMRICAYGADLGIPTQVELDAERQHVVEQALTVQQQIGTTAVLRDNNKHAA